MTVPSVEPLARRTAACPCGCGRELGIFDGRVNFEEGFSFAYLAGTLRCSSGRPNMWVMVRMAALPGDDQRDCWVAMHLWDDGENVVTSIIDAEESPLTKALSLGERLLSREAVLAQPGLKGFSITARLRIVKGHPELARFFGDS